MESSFSTDTEANSQTPPRRRMTRNHSADTLQPVLRPPVHRFTSSSPSTPIAKAVRFDDSQLERISHFFRLEQPRAVSEPIESQMDTTSEIPDHSEPTSPPRPLPRRLAVVPTNFPENISSRRGSPVWLKNLWLSRNQVLLFGSIAVANLGFHKQVVCRFTFDGWTTISDTKAYYSPHIDSPDGYDIFVFDIDLTNIPCLTSKIMRCCVRYTVNGCDYWDNNDDANFEAQLVFTTAEKPDPVPKTKEIEHVPDNEEVGQVPAHRYHLLSRLTNLSVSRSSFRYDLNASLSDAVEASKEFRQKNKS